MNEGVCVSMCVSMSVDNFLRCLVLPLCISVYETVCLSYGRSWETKYIRYFEQLKFAIPGSKSNSAHLQMTPSPNACKLCMKSSKTVSTRSMTNYLITKSVYFAISILTTDA